MQLMSKMVFRRFMLRKGVALLLALIFVVSTVGLYIAFVNVTTDVPITDRQASLVKISPFSSDKLDNV